MSLDPEYFSLENALASVWNDQYTLEQNHKRLIRLCIPGEDFDLPPRGEPEFDLVQRALISCELLSSIASDEPENWLSPDGQQFPSAVRRFIHGVACRFHFFEGQLPDQFSDSLVEFLRETRSHVVTTNYDNLLYQSLIERGVLKGFDGALVDGFTRSGFDEDNLERRYGRDFGWYLHLHGSPLFYTDRRGRHLKMRQNELEINQGDESDHIVLTHITHKRSIIDHSQVLSTYSNFFERALLESEEIIRIGYGGLDTHLNERIIRSGRDTPVRVIERTAAGDLESRKRYWEGRINSTNVEQYDDILDFMYWR